MILLVVSTIFILLLLLLSNSCLLVGAVVEVESRPAALPATARDPLVMHREESQYPKDTMQPVAARAGPVGGSALVELVDDRFGPNSRNRLPESRDPGGQGAGAALESFYYALNNADLDTLSAVWSPAPLVRLNNPLGGILHGHTAVIELYRMLFAGELHVQIAFTDVAAYRSPALVVFAGREIGGYQDEAGDSVRLEIRTTRVFGYDEQAGRWLQLHHHGSIDQPAALHAYQQAAQRGKATP